MDIFLATLASVVLYWAINAIYNSIGWIFQIELFYEFKRRFREVLFDLSCPFFVTLLFCVLRENRNPDKMVSGSHFLNIMLNFILTPALILFTVIVYIYIFKLFFDWEFP